MIADLKLKSHLPRLREVWSRHPVFFITTCTAGRRPLLANPVAHALLVAEWAGMSARRGWSVGRYVVMPDHVHFFVAPSADCSGSLSDVIRSWKAYTSRALRHALTADGPVWERGFFDHVLRSSESREEKWNYVRQNPVRAGLVAAAADWPYAGAIDFD